MKPGPTGWPIDRPLGNGFIHPHLTSPGHTAPNRKCKKITTTGVKLAHGSLHNKISGDKEQTLQAVQETRNRHYRLFMRQGTDTTGCS
jgi:hypothetical protein